MSNRFLPDEPELDDEDEFNDDEEISTEPDDGCDLLGGYERDYIRDATDYEIDREQDRYERRFFEPRE